MRFATRWALSSEPRTSTANSSPPMRATRSPSRTQRSIRLAACRRAASPTWCPLASLMPLKLSRSTKSTLTVGDGSARRRSSDSTNAVRFASWVSGSDSSDCSLARHAIRWVTLAARMKPPWISGPLDRVPLLAGAVDRARVEPAHDRVLGRGDQHADRERDPVLVERDDAEHHEEVEVRLGDPAREVDDRGRGEHQADRRADRAQPPPDRHVEPHQRGQADDRDVDQRGGQAEPAQQRVAADADRLDDREPADQPVAAGPDRLGQRASLGQPGHGLAQQPPQAARTGGAGGGW